MKMMDLDMSYFTFVEERYRIWERRQDGQPSPWTYDSILATRKFTNVFRVLDYGSQFLARMLYEEGTPEDVFMRCFLYRYTNLPESWQMAYTFLGHWPRVGDLETLRTIWKNAHAGGERVFSGAYVILPAPNQSGNKIDQAIDLTHRALKTVWPQFRDASWDMEARHRLLRSLYGCGDFLAMQILTDWGYGPHGDDQDEDLFIVPGPGCRKGLKAWGWEGDPVEGIRYATDAWAAEPDAPVLWTKRSRRALSLMDVQNTFCEFFKYDRYRRSDKPAGQPYRSQQTQPEKPFLPVHW